MNAEPAARDRLKVVLVTDFNVKVGQRIYSAADISEQISAAGKEASGMGKVSAPQTHSPLRIKGRQSNLMSRLRLGPAVS